MPNIKRALSEAACPITRAVDVLGDKWTLLILKNANVGMTRFDEFRSDLGIADNILSARLSRLVEMGLMVRVPYEGTGRTRHEYKLTQAGADILPVFHTLAEWGQKHTTIEGLPATPILFIHTACGNPLERGEYCPSCDVTVSREDEAWVRPWRTPVVATLADPAAEAPTS
ncbi:winged helix-turn-helix transcriptional regulator [Rhodococcus sp. NPDC057529]|uniref:winged helix-turn-helix transcriptional regulator n=1 Tax=Rhodococcus sp. NPDC057529 TaxID=3346158 RepID=UPI00366C92DC